MQHPEGHHGVVDHDGTPAGSEEHHHGHQHLDHLDAKNILKLQRIKGESSSSKKEREKTYRGTEGKGSRLIEIEKRDGDEMIV